MRQSIGQEDFLRPGEENLMVEEQDGGDELG
jgi:hypothetical protein